MKRSLTTTLLQWTMCGLLWLGASRLLPAIANEVPLSEQGPAARDLLDDWHSDTAEPGDRKLHIVCWTPNDREFPTDYEARLDRILKHIQTFYADQMARHGLGRRTIQLDLSDDGRLKIHTVQGHHPTARYGKQSGTEIRQECLPVLAKAGIDGNRETLVIFCNLAIWDPQQLTFTHESPYYAGGSHRSGTAWQLDSPELDISNLARTEPIIRDGQYGKISLGKHNSIFIGGIAHELGHALSLPHCTARPDERDAGTPLMGSGNRTYGDELRGEGRGSVLSLAHALRLASHPQFSQSVKGLDTQATATADEIEIVAQGDAIAISGTVTGTPPLYGVVAYFDPAGGGDYNATTMTAIPNKNGAFSLRCSALTAGQAGELRVVLLHVNGATSDLGQLLQMPLAYQVDAEGRPDLTQIEMGLRLRPIVQALNREQSAVAQKLVAAIRTPSVRRVAERLVSANAETDRLKPLDYRGKSRQVPLTDFQPSSAKVGWLRPSYDQVPNAMRVIASAGKIYETGIYAHAPARHTYELGGRWDRFRGRVGIATGSRGSVVFVIEADGKTLATSPTVGPENTIEFDVDVAGAQQLTLITEPTADGPSSDWGLWLEPQLVRSRSR